MKYEKYQEVAKAAEQFCGAAYAGCRKQRNKAEDMKANWIKQYASERAKNSKYAVIRHTVNHGTANFQDNCFQVEVFDIVKNHNIETDKTFRNQYGSYIFKSSIIGWLS